MFGFSFFLLVSNKFCLCQQNKRIRACVAGLGFGFFCGFFFPENARVFSSSFFARFQLFDFGKEIIVEKVFLEMMTEAKLYSFVENRGI